MTGKTILTVDDSASVRQMVVLTLESAGYDVIEAINGQDALDKIDQPLSMVITDLNMPRLNGLGLIRALRAHPRQKAVPIIMLTAEWNETIRQTVYAAGATGWIVKPFQPEQLLAEVRRVLA